MAKETKHSPLLLVIVASLLTSGAWLMASFPIFIFFGLAPLFSLTDRASSTSAVWEKMEWVRIPLFSAGPLTGLIYYFLQEKPHHPDENRDPVL